MLPGHDDEGFLAGAVVEVVSCYLDQGDGPPQDGGADAGDGDLGVFLNLFDEPPEICEVIGQAVCELYAVILNCEVVGEGESFIVFVFVILIVEFIFIVKDIESFPPPNSLGALIALLGLDDGLHTHTVQ